MPRTLIPAAAAATASPILINPIIIAFKPRQVLLASSSTSIMTPDSAKSPTLTEENKSLLRHSIAQYLQKTGLSKTLKKFRSEAHLKEDGNRGLTLDLEEMCFRYLEKANPLVTRESDAKLEEVNEPSKNVESEDAVENKKRKKDKKKDSKSLTTDKENQPSEPLPLAEESKDTKKKKKSKTSADASVSEDDTKADKEDQPSESLPQLETKAKDKKKKKSKISADASVTEDETNSTEAAKENGVPKKRKREESPEEEVDTKTKSLDESKRRKKDDGSKEKSTKASKSNENQVDECAGQKDQMDLGEAEKTPSKPLSGNENGTLEKSGGKFSESKSSKKQRNGSAEPQSTTAKAFQRIKVEEVEFAHDKLKDNSYWAKDGADTGYGAKAQEVLGQVRGRDFRHEKTKKKRGSYRGGQIDLDSHSFKFNYSDGE